MTDCPNGEMRDLLPDLLHAQLAPAQRVAVEAHVAACAACRAELALLGTVRHSLRPRSAVDASAIVAALPSYRAAGGGRRSGWRAAAAVAAIVLGGTSLVLATRDAGPERTAGVATVPRGDTTGPLTLAGPAPAARVATLGSGLSAPRAAAGAPRELALEHGVGDLTDGELSALLAELEALDVMPVVDVESTPLVPGSALPSSGGTS